MQAADSSIKPPSQDLPAAVQGLIEAAVAAFDADRDNSRTYLLRASALLRSNPRADGSGSTARSKSRGGLLAWELRRVVEHIETRLADPIMATDLANLIDVSVGRFFRAFKVSVGVGPIRYVAMRRVEAVCTMLTTTREPLSQIALACGLSDKAHLCKVFRRTIGMSPSAWRRAMTTRDAPCECLPRSSTTIELRGEHKLCQRLPAPHGIPKTRGSRRWVERGSAPTSVSATSDADCNSQEIAAIPDADDR